MSADTDVVAGPSGADLQEHRARSSPLLIEPLSRQANAAADAIPRAFAERLGSERGAFDLEAATLALQSYQSGRSCRMAQRESGVPEKTIDRWVTLLGIKRSREQTAQLKAAALSSGRLLSAEVRRTVGAL